jgi:serine/threonine-protein kinase
MGPIIWLREQRVMGESIRTHLRRGPLALTQAIKLGLHVLEALADAERCRIVHRDVKPDNVMMDLNGDFWLLDFGSARHLDLESLTATSPFGGTGTPGYAPPEQYQNRKSEIDARADLFALGVTLYEAISGANPHTSGARDVRETLRRVDGGALPLLSIKGDSGGKISEFVTTLAQPRREHRPRSVAEALAWLSQLALENSNRGM